jgi:hypothetical protein
MAQIGSFANDSRCLPVTGVLMTAMGVDRRPASAPTRNAGRSDVPACRRSTEPAWVRSTPTAGVTTPSRRDHGRLQRVAPTVDGCPYPSNARSDKRSRAWVPPHLTGRSTVGRVRGRGYARRQIRTSPLIETRTNQNRDLPRIGCHDWSNRMKALVTQQPAAGLWLADAPEPDYGINDVLINVRKTGICGTDLHIFNWDEWAQKTIPVPLVIGHEFMGEIVAAGSKLTKASAMAKLKCGDVAMGVTQPKRSRSSAATATSRSLRSSGSCVMRRSRRSAKYQEIQRLVIARELLRQPSRTARLEAV